MREWVDYLIYFRHLDSESSSGALTESTIILHEEEVISVDDIVYMESRIEKEQGYQQVDILAFSKIG